ncbi:hypothetical protein BGZ83_003391, partial [Gryganskiella cystojenkinii]
NNSIIINRPPRPEHFPQRDTAGQIKINIRNLPTGAPRQLNVLMTTLSLFGKVELVGFYKDARSGYFESEGMAIITPGPLSEELTRVVQFPEWKNRPIYFSWNGAPKICNFCEQEGLIAIDCPELAKTECNDCHQKGHTFRVCPENSARRIAVVQAVAAQDAQQHNNNNENNENNENDNNNNENNNQNEEDNNQNDEDDNRNTDGEDEDEDEHHEEEESEGADSESENDSDSDDEERASSPKTTSNQQQGEAEGSMDLDEKEQPAENTHSDIEMDQAGEPDQGASRSKKAKIAAPTVEGS